MHADQASALPQLSALLGVPYSDLEPWLNSVSPSSPQLPQQWPSDTQTDAGQYQRPGPPHQSHLQTQQLISLAAFAVADAGKVSAVGATLYGIHCHRVLELQTLVR